ncbi:MAG TPA: hypothetical protein PKY59_25650 [Pyrinomonadaceae bacterium]|nr:hypothetical protein [Pyrinomonadaceae bacterium]
MKFLLSIAAIFLLFICSNAQTQKIGKDEYDAVFQNAVRITNADYPFIFTVITEYIEKGKTVRTVTEVREAQDSGYERIKTTETAKGKTTNKYQIRVGFGNIFCSDDGKSWKRSQYECESVRTIFGSRETESVEYSVTEKTANGEKIKVYRKYTVFASSNGEKGNNFKEEISTIDLRGFFLNVIATEGTINPKTTNRIMKQSWTMKAKIAPIVAPIK